MTPAARHAELVAAIREADHRYYVLDAPTLSDAQYDALLRELRTLEAAHPELATPASPTQRVGGKVAEGFAKVRRKKPMMSLDNALSADDVREFDRRVRDGLRAGEAYRYVCEPKIDGGSLEVVYEGGRLVQASTRGDGETGEDVTANVRTIRALPLELRDARTFTTRGEVIIFKKDLDAINAQRESAGEEPFMNARNAAAGSLRLTDPSITAQRPLRVLLYDLVERWYETQHAMLAGLHALGLPTHRREKICETLDDVLAYVDAFESSRAKLPYAVDGVVVKLDDFAQRDRLGATTRFPRWATAYKYAPEQAATTVKEIEVDVGRTGIVSFVAIFEPPVVLAGTTVARATLHNADLIASKDVRIGDTVRVEKAGEVIPQVVSVDVSKRPRGAEPWRPPTHCPWCRTALVRDEGAVALRCPNERCPARVLSALFHFTRRDAMDVEGIGVSLASQLLHAGLVHDVADVFALREKRDALVALPRMGDKSADHVLAAVDAARTGRTLTRLLVGLGIPLVGEVAARLVAKRYRTLRALLDAPPDDVRAALAEIHGIGDKIADSVARWLAREDSRALCEKLLALGVVAEEPPEEAPREGPLTGKSFCVTGVLSRPRDAIHADIRAAGGEIHDSVKKGTTYLVAGERVGATKLEAAKKRGTIVIDEAALAALIAGGAA